jgi:hypothetical protein
MCTHNKRCVYPHRNGGPACEKCSEIVTKTVSVCLSLHECRIHDFTKHLVTDGRTIKQAKVTYLVISKLQFRETRHGSVNFVTVYRVPTNNRY